jgi:hypothetical protein
MATTPECKTPPEVLAELLREDRAAGFSFDDVFEENVRLACGPSRKWRTALEAMKGVWLANWHNEPDGRGVLSRDLSDDTSDHSPVAVLLA